MARAKITKLTPEQEAQIPAIRDEFLRIGLSTEPADFDAAEEAIKDAYRVAGLEPPKLFIRLASPLEGAIGAAILKNTKFDRAQVWDQVWDQVWAQVRAQVWDQVGAQVGAQVRAQVGAQVRDQVWDQVGAQVWAQVRDQVWDQVWAQVWDQVRAQVRDQVRAQVRDQVWAQVRAQVRDQVGAQVGAQVWDQVGAQVGAAFYSQHEAGYLGWLAFFSRACGLAGCEKIEPLARIAASCGWVWFFSGAVIMTDRPRTLRRDEQNRLHCENGPAVEYRDGFSVYAWHGWRVPSDWIENRETIDPAIIIKHENVEMRAVGAEIIGWSRMMEALDAKVIDSDTNPDHGDLIELTLPGLREPGLFLRAYCKRNGLIVEGVPRVSDIDGKPIKTVRAAQAWSFGKPEASFQYPDYVS